MEELDIVSNQHLSIEMHLLRLIHLKSFRLKKITNNDLKKEENINHEKISQINNNETINQIKNVAQENNQTQIKTEAVDNISIN